MSSARVYMQHILYDKFSYDNFYFTGVNVSASLLWQVYFDNPLANRIKCSDYFVKFSLLTHTDEHFFCLYRLN